MTRFSKWLTAAAVVVGFGLAAQSASAAPPTIIVNPTIRPLPGPFPRPLPYPIYHDHDYVVLYKSSPFGGWINYGRSSRRVRAVSVSKSGSFTMPAPPEGEYRLIAIPDSAAADWQNPAFLARLAAMADRIQVRDGQSVTQTLRLQRVQ